MIVPWPGTSSYGQCSVRSSAASVWNDLPSELKDSGISRHFFLNRALNPGFLIMLTHDKHLWELLFRGSAALYNYISNID